MSNIHSYITIYEGKTCVDGWEMKNKKVTLVENISNLQTEVIQSNSRDKNNLDEIKIKNQKNKLKWTIQSNSTLSDKIARTTPESSACIAPFRQHA